MFDAIIQKIPQIERDKQVQLIYVAESGSRAWGFASPDSDYDVRGIFLQPQAAYLSIDEPQETFEWIENQWFDVGAWDIRKALRLLRKSNSVLLEWLQSPIVYQNMGDTQQALLALAALYFQPRSVLYHYRGIAKTASSGQEGGQMRLKKWFYVLRPLLAAYWVVSEQSMPPMTLSALLVLLPGAEQEELRALTLFKATQAEDYLWTPTPSLAALIERLWALTDVSLPVLAVPDSQPLNDWFKAQW